MRGGVFIARRPVQTISSWPSTPQIGGDHPSGSSVASARALANAFVGRLLALRAKLNASAGRQLSMLCRVGSAWDAYPALRVRPNRPATRLRMGLVLVLVLELVLARLLNGGSERPYRRSAVSQ